MLRGDRLAVTATAEHGVRCGACYSRVVQPEGERAEPAVAESRATDGLLAKRNGPAAVRIVVQLAAVSGALVATQRLAAIGNPAWIFTVCIAGFSLAGLFAAEHEAGHGTAFASKALNEITVSLCAFAMLQAPTFFREFHWQHHRHTQDREHDPEIAGAPDLLDGWPSSVPRYLLLVSGLPLMIGKAGFTVLCAVIPNDAVWERIFPFVRASRRARVRFESGLVVFGWGVVSLLGLALVPKFFAVALALPVAHFALGLYLMAEHTGLPSTGTQAERTRSTTSNALVRFWMWNMPHHTEHHVHPAVPFHALPELQDRLGDTIVHRSPGYLALHRQAIARAWSGAQPPEPL